MGSLKFPTDANAALDANALGDAAFCGNIGAVRQLLASESDVNVSDSAGFGALHRAAIGGSAEALQVLVASGADINARDSAGDTPLHYAAFCGHLSAVTNLLSANADATLPSADGRTPLTAALDEGHTAAASAIIAHLQNCAPGADWPGKNKVQGQASDGGGPLSYSAAISQLGDAAFAGDLRSVFTLLSSSGGGPGGMAVDVNGADPDGFTCLHRAAAGGSLPVVELLLGHGADFNSRDLAGCTPMHYASFCGHTDIVHCLLGSGGDPAR